MFTYFTYYCVNMWILLISYISLLCFFVIDGIFNEEKSVDATTGIEEILESVDVVKMIQWSQLTCNVVNIKESNITSIVNV